MLLRLSCLTYLLVSLTACQNQESQARDALDSAILKWDEGSFEIAVASFDSVIQDFPSTQAARAASEEKSSRIEVYKAQRSQKANAQRNTGKLGRKVIDALELYGTDTGGVPESLSSVRISRDADGYAERCDYTKALWGEGYWLDCTKVEAMYAHGMETITAARKAIKEMEDSILEQSTSGRNN